ncbi:hypothetical protein ARMGADRAFT_1015796 [Armillaria gallica]|uniref:Smr domain-containing protein n=1 Tax=Armillaria gallica TaxID=47427 RepID=A0A2H3D4I6_ARMGA|nr:hypothetical protein ARMGADRAFT_1015796 [Armillaria gallica]
MSIVIGVVIVVVLLTICCWPRSSQDEQDTLPVHRPQQQPVYQPPPRPPLPSQSYRPSPYTPLLHQPEQHQPDDNQTDQSNEYYNDLRVRANKEGDEMARCFSESHEAYNRGDGAAAKDLSNQGKDRNPGEIDLHGLYVKEAIAYTDAALAEAKLRGDSEIRLIVGKGSHSEGGIAKVRLAIEELMRKYQLVAELDPSNSGVLVVELNGR